MMNPFAHASGWALGMERSLGTRATRAAGVSTAAALGWWGGAKGAAGAGAYLGALGRGNPTVWGATLGAGWGMASDDTSVLGGAAIGAGIGRYGGAGNRLMWAAARAGRNTPMAGLSYFGRGAMGQGRRDWRFAYAQGRASASYIGRTSKKTWGFIRGLGS